MFILISNLQKNNLCDLEKQRTTWKAYNLRIFNFNRLSVLVEYRQRNSIGVQLKKALHLT
jgi:hypothetical protein